ncbi:MAG: glycoside hydrolase family 3 C-terminal domain-containing protein [Halieaceae bacterium]|nr:glycoside hydrolase family 3 C-terminal domain-containing protein [Halieaceae bacterium]MCP5187869.1 glycoside hydrolase family 3 C-terminal domain-containing protein [Pseudomonadales bacterium]
MLDLGDRPFLLAASELVQQLSNAEKATLCTGRTFWELHGVARLGLPSLWVTDGPHGLRKQQGDSDHIGLNDSVPAVCFPPAVGLASTWNRDLLQEIGAALGEACVSEKVSVLLGPGVNIKRSPLCGRNFEYFSEDPYLAGQMGAAWVRGVQSQGVGTSLKHYAANNQESHRMVVDAIVDERTLREIYLPGFEITVTEAQPWTVMCSYNKLNGTYLAENHRLLTGILKDEWGHTGLVVTDWGACNDRVEGIAAGLELEMPGNGGIHTPAVLAALGNGELSEAQLDAAATRVVELILKSRPAFETDRDYDRDAHHLLARQAAEQACVLLKNDGALLPLAKGGKLAVIGALAVAPRYQGSGSSQINPTRLDIPLAEIQRLLGSEQAPRYAAGYNLDDDACDQRLIDEALAIARDADTVVLFAGLPDSYESEGFDRTHMRLPAAQLQLIEAVARLTERLVVVLQNGAPVELPFVDRVPALLETYLGGQAGGSAVARILFGEANPSGKLAETFPARLEDAPCQDWFPGEPRQVQYREGLWVGYRYFSSTETPVAFPFGHGLSYTTFAYHKLRLAGEAGNWTVDATQLGDWDGLRLQCEIENTGAVAGYEIAQLYIGAPSGAVYRPRRELRSFAKVWLEPGQTGTVVFELGSRAFAHWCTHARDWRVAPGEYRVEVGASCADIRLDCALQVLSTHQAGPRDPALAPYFEPAKRAFNELAFAALLGRPLAPVAPARPYHPNSTLGDVQSTLLGKLLHQVILRTMKKMAPAGSDEKTERMMAAMVAEMPLRNLVVFSRGRFSPRDLQLCIQLMNGQYRTALQTLLSGRR